MPSPSARSPRSGSIWISRLSTRPLAVFGVLALFGICRGIAQAPVAPQSRPAAVAPAAAAEQESAPAKGDASHQGVKVHGHWKIVVKNPDGSVAQTREFENSLTAAGALFLAELLTGYSPGQFAILLTTTGTSICATNCALVPNTSTGIGGTLCQFSLYACFSGLTTSVTNPPAVITLSGQLTAAHTGTITTVATFSMTCSGTVAPSTCETSTAPNLTSLASFTSTTVAAVAVTSGQIVQVTVAISFS